MPHLLLSASLGKKYIRHSSGHSPKSTFLFPSEKVCYTNPPTPSDFKGPTNTCGLQFDVNLREKWLINISCCETPAYCVRLNNRPGEAGAVLITPLSLIC